MTMPIDASDEPLVVLDRVSKRYGAGEIAVDALKDVSLRVTPGEFVVVLGPSGSGKTTMLNLIGGIEQATSGTVTVAGQDLGTLKPDGLARYRRETVGFVFQFFNLVPTLTALENVQLIAELGLPDGEGRSHTSLDAVGLRDREDHLPGALSGGQQQRVAIARAVVKDPPLLLCDEPTGSLDLETGRQILDLLRRSTGNGRTVVLVTHNSAIGRIADRVIRMGSGRIVEDRRVAEPIPAMDVDW